MHLVLSWDVKVRPHIILYLSIYIDLYLYIHIDLYRYMLLLLTFQCQDLTPLVGSVDCRTSVHSCIVLCRAWVFSLSTWT